MLQDWLSEMRLRTLLLGGTNCAVGCALGFYYGSVNCITVAAAFFIVLTGMLLQLISNLANDYGDAFRGADGAGRGGPIRAVMAGNISMSLLRKAMALVILLAAFTGLAAVCLSFMNDIQALAWFLFLGVVAIIAALFYTVGMAYGYKGFGDIAVFVFFGLVAVLGSQVMITNASGSGMEVYPDAVLLATSIGASSVMVLHVANMRDIDEDRRNGKKTIAVRLGCRMARVYHALLFTVVAVTSFLACVLSHKAWELFILVFAILPLFASAVRAIRTAHEAKKVARERKYTLIGITIYNLAWIAVLTLDYWFYLL